jgi:archaemetzincin
MTVGIVPVGNVDGTVLVRIKDGLPRVFPSTACSVVDERMPLTEKTFDKKRGQHRSNQILATFRGHVCNMGFNSVLGVLDADIFVPELNFVFGEAGSPGKVALISLWRLKPEFYGDVANLELQVKRALKEAVHEIGHTLGLKHCPRSSCVMHFSNSIFDTDRKQSLFCDDCYLKVALAINSLK